MSYAYDVNGIRASKTVDGVKHTYVYDGTQLLAERYGTTRLEFMYNESGQPHLVQFLLEFRLTLEHGFQARKVPRLLFK